MKPATPLYFAFYRGYLCTAESDGSIPLNSNVVCKVDEQTELMAFLLVRANAYPRLVEFVRHVSNLSTVAPYQEAERLLKELGE